MIPALPEPEVFRQQSRHEDGWSDHYGAMQTAFAYAGRPMPARYVLRGFWQHGCLGPWEAVTPGAVVFNTPGARERPAYVARREEADYLAAHGYEQARAIGMPILYAPPSGLARVPRSLLIMPTHTLVGDQFPNREAFARYADEVKELARGFEHVTVCVHPSCQRNGLWISEFKERGFDLITGAQTNDARALHRMRALFEQYETVTTNGWGSHIAYALVFGARVSLTGTRPAFDRNNLMRDTAWAADRRSLELTLADDCQRQQNEFLRPFMVSPAAAVADRALGEWLTGWNHRLDAAGLATMLREFVVADAPALPPPVCARPLLFVVPPPAPDGAAEELLRFLGWLRREGRQDFSVLIEEGHPLRSRFVALVPVHARAELAANPALLGGFAAWYAGSTSCVESLEGLGTLGSTGVIRITAAGLRHTRLAPRYLAAALRCAGHFVADSEGAADELRRVYGVRVERITVRAPVAHGYQAGELWTLLHRLVEARGGAIAPGATLAEIYAGWQLAEVSERAYVQAQLVRAQARAQARSLERAGRRRESVQAWVQAVGRDLATKDPLIIVESLSEIGTDLTAVDAKQSALLLAKAAEIARTVPWDFDAFLCSASPGPARTAQTAA